MRPRIALALGGGVARGWAHIGVLHALRAHGFEPDIVCGTSIGAVVGGLYAAGKLDALERWARSLSARRIFGLLDFNFAGGGLFSGEHLAAVLKEQIGGLEIEALGRPFAAVATELQSGHEVWLRNGPLLKAIRASYALPGVFSPQPWDGMWLVDGALVNPCPISVARAMGGRLVIAVSLHTDILKAEHPDPEEPQLPLQPPKQTEGPFSAFGRWLRPDRLIVERIFSSSGPQPALAQTMIGALDILLDRVSRARLAGDPADVLITPKVGRIGLIEFDRAKETIALGADAARAAIPAIEDAIKRLR